MPWEDPQFIEEFNSAWPLPTDEKREGDDHLRSIKAAINASFPNTSGAWSTTNPISAGAPVAPTNVVTLGYAENVGLGQTTWGAIDGAGNIVAGTGFTVNRTGVGVYEITFDQVATVASNQIIVCQLILNVFYSSQNAFADPNAANMCTVYLSDGSQPDDLPFHFQRTVLP